MLKQKLHLLPENLVQQSYLRLNLPHACIYHMHEAARICPVSL